MPSIVIARNQASSQNLVESTKLKRIVIDSKSVQRQDKKERRKHEKEKREKSHKHSSKKVVHVDKKQLVPSKKTSSESDQLEKSGLTEELGGPQNQLGYLSDGSQNSKKRKREASPPAVESLIKAAPVAGKPLRIRLIFKKPKVESPSLPQEDLVACSISSAESQSVVCSKVCEPKLDVSSTSEAAVNETKKICEPELNVPSTSVAAIDETKKRKKHKPSKEDRYNALFDDWTPPSFMCVSAMEVDSSSKDDDDWLFGSRTQERLNCKAAVKIDEDVNTSMQRSSDSSWPRAQFLSQVGIYSLPYAVPF